MATGTRCFVCANVLDILLIMMIYVAVRSRVLPETNDLGSSTWVPAHNKICRKLLVSDFKPAFRGRMHSCILQAFCLRCLDAVNFLTTQRLDATLQQYTLGPRRVFSPDPEHQRICVQ